MIKGIESLDNSIKKLFSLNVDSNNSKKILNIVAKNIRGDVESNFLSERDPYGNPWAELTSYTRKNKKRRQEILQDTGALMEEMTSMDNYIISGNKLDVVTTVTGESPNDFYGQSHNEGIGVTKRQFLDYTDNIHNSIDEDIIRFLQS